MTRQHLIEQIRRHIYNGQPNQDANISVNLVNQLINQGIGVVAKQNYVDSLKIDGISYVNNSFYTTFKNLAVSKDENLLYKVTLPQLPFGIGSNEGISRLVFKDSFNNISIPCVPLTQNQTTYFRSLRKPSNRVLFYSEGIYVFAFSSLPLYQYTAQVTMVSGGDSTDLTSTLNVPDDYIPGIIDYCVKLLTSERFMPKDVMNDGQDAIKQA